MRVAIVGSRRWQDRGAVEAAVAALPAGSVVVSGGCRGVDSWAVAAARRRGLAVAVHRPDLAGVRCRGEAAARYHARNQRIVEDSDRMIAFRVVSAEGGTEDVIRRARAAGIPVEVREEADR